MQKRKTAVGRLLANSSNAAGNTWFFIDTPLACGIIGGLGFILAGGSLAAGFQA